MTLMWLDASSGMAGDMLMGALIDAGADLSAMQAAVDAVVPGSVRLVTSTVERQGMRAVKADVQFLVENPPYRDWNSIRQMLADADLAPITKTRALTVFAAIAEAEAHVHGVSPDQVHFHEVGALDSIADIVACCEGLRSLGVTRVVATQVAVGAGHVHVAHGRMPIPVPAVAQLAVGWPTYSGAMPSGGDGHHHDHEHSHEHSHDHNHGDEPAHDHARSHEHSHEHDHEHDHEHGHGHEHEHNHDHEAHSHHDHGTRVVHADQPGELCTPTGMALVTCLAERPSSQPAMTTSAVGIGAGSKEIIGFPNIVRVVLGDEAPGQSHHLVDELAANIDDLDPRVWPDVVDQLLSAGAVDAWIDQVIMKKGRPGVVVHALASHEDAERLSQLIIDQTTTLGVRRYVGVQRSVLDRAMAQVSVDGQPVAVKIGYRDRLIVRVQPEYEDARAAADALAKPVLEVLRSAIAAAHDEGLVEGAAVPDELLS